MKSNKLFYSWVAAFLEGEGTIRKYKSGGKISITQALDKNRTVMSTMKLLKKYFKGHVYYQKQDNPKYKQIIKWDLTNRKHIIYFLKCIQPYCLLRKKDVSNLLNYLIADNFTFKRYLVYLPKIKKYLAKGLSYQKISKKLKYAVSDTTICRRRKEVE
jgi:hypothetical protein